MPINWSAMTVMCIVKLLRRLNCFIGPDEVDPSAAFLNERDRNRNRNHIRIWQPVYEELLPGLPNSLVLESIVPGIPWYARPLLKATSRAWNNTLDGLSALDLRRTRTISPQYGNKDRDSGLEGGECDLVKVKRFGCFRYVISLYDPEQEIWHNLPPLPCGSLPPTPIFAGFLGIRESKNSIQVDYVRGKVIAATVYGVPESSMCGACIWTLDIEGGMWKWEERHSIHTEKREGFPITANMVVLEGKLYISRHGAWDWVKPMVYDVANDEWGQLPGFDRTYFYSIRERLNGDTGKFTKCVIAKGPVKVTKELDPLTGTWKDFVSKGQQGAATHDQRRWPELVRNAWRQLAQERAAKAAGLCQMCGLKHT